MTSAELRRIVGRIPVGLSESLRADMLTDGYRHEVAAAVVAAIDHSTALVALLESCERFKAAREATWQASSDGATRLANEELSICGLDVIQALDRVHATKAP